MSFARIAAILLATFISVCGWGGIALAFTPNDTYNSYQWNFGQLGMGDAWDLNLGGSSDIKVAVVDTGVAYENYAGYYQVSDLSLTHFDTANAWDFVDGDAHANDENGHGTHVSGTIAQSTNNAMGVAGVAFNVTLLPIRILNADGEGSAADLASAIDLAVAAGADVINLSLGGGAYGDVQAAIDRAYRAGVLVVAAAGNDGGTQLDYPAAYGQVLAVGATDAAYNLASYSAHTSDMVVAPGGDLSVDFTGDGYGDGVLQQYLDGNYWFLDGTSMATGHVSATAALILSEAQDLGLSVPSGPDRVDWLKNVITSTTMDLGAAGQDSVYGYGLVRAENSLRLLDTAAASSDGLPFADYQAVSSDAYVDLDYTPQASGNESVYSTMEVNRAMLTTEPEEKPLH